MPLAEIWHSSWLDHHWGGPIAWWQSWGLNTTPIGGSDWHNATSPTPIGTPTTWLAVDAAAETPAELVAATLQALAAGRTAVSHRYTAPVLLRVGDEIVALDAPNTLVVAPTEPTTP